MPSIYYILIFWVYWAITAVFGGALVAALIKGRERSVQSVAAMVLVPVILRLLLIK